MEKNIIITIVVSILFLVIKFLEVRFIQKDETKPLKDTIKDTIVVGIATMIGLYVSELSLNTASSKAFTNAFVGKPDF